MKLDEYYKIIQNSRPKLRFCQEFTEESPLWNFDRHSHPYLELMYFLDGKGDLEVSGTKMSISLFDTVVYPAGWPHRENPVSEKQRRIICLWIELPELQLETPIQLHDRDNALRQLFRSIHRETKRQNPEPLLLEYEMKLLLIMLLRDQTEAVQEQTPMTEVLQYIHARYTEKLTLAELAELEHISKSYLSRQFKRRTGMTVISYINSLRIDAAKRLLAGTSQSVNEIAYQVGFESPKYFYRTFKALVGESPNSFRRHFQKAEF